MVPTLHLFMPGFATGASCRWLAWSDEGVTNSHVVTPRFLSHALSLYLISATLHLTSIVPRRRRWRGGPRMRRLDPSRELTKQSCVQLIPLTSDDWPSDTWITTARIEPSTHAHAPNTRRDRCRKHGRELGKYASGVVVIKKILYMIKQYRVHGRK